ncbi:MAG TPA: MazG-like family protein [Chloroflexota bacterium]|jgi:NTP pyrophosphatase (non-canonical NTP hydrolase)|nr:MazG-like family protein [Chloroflexota bacterium]
MPDTDTTLQDLREQVRTFVREREWEQFHSVKELATAIAIEAAELMEPLLWMAPGEAEQALQQPATRRQVEEELADVLILCMSLANKLDSDLSAVVAAKLRANAAKYPADQARGSARKYTHYLRAQRSGE